ncbi:hypothetical protein DCCM_2402 [Desulfocucumis palustris]|uniref:Uncharacterized protein n=1 Tax=Desulfocucumis palustris TaxID=1898651 RepID=A0A2L2XC81_9FIRM|nr:hypothetical protein DCCM_2402 [Desulfocucumis palustris]
MWPIPFYWVVIGAVIGEKGKYNCPFSGVFRRFSNGMELALYSGASA